MIVMNVYCSSGTMKVLMNLDVNEKAQGVVQENIWKTIPFKLEKDAKVRISVTAIANDNGRRDDDDLKWALNSEDFGWATDKAWDGRDLRGQEKEVVIERSMLAGNHRIIFWADQNPILKKIRIEIEDRDPSKGPAIKEITYIEKIGVRIIWENIPDNRGYGVFRKGVKDRDYVNIGKVNETSYVDTTVVQDEKYRYKIGVIGSKNIVAAFSGENEISIIETVPPLVPTGLRVIESNPGKIVINWEKNKESDFAKYFIYRKIEESNNYSKYSEIEGKDNNKFEDKDAFEGKKYSYRVSAIDLSGNESEKSQELIATVKASRFIPSEVMGVYPEEAFPGTTITIYFSDKKSKQIRRARQNLQRKDQSIKINPSKIFLRYGFNGWDARYLLPENESPLMVYDEEIGYWKTELKIPYFAKEVNIAFKDELDNYDRNWSKDYIVKVSKDNVPPSAPTNLKSFAGNNFIYLEWIPATDIDISGYEVRKSKDPNLGFMDPDSLVARDIKTSYYRDTKVKAGETYYYKVLSQDFSGNQSSMSDSIMAVANSTGVILNESVAWEPVAPSDGESVKLYYIPLKGKVRGAKSYFAKIGVDNWNQSVKATEIKEMLYDKIIDGWYVEYVIAGGIKEVNVLFGDGDSRWDDNTGSGWKISVKPDTTAPVKVENFKSKPQAKEIVLMWDFNKESDMAGYNLYRGKTKINQNLIVENRYEDKNLAESTDFEYRIVAVDRSGNVSEENVIKAGTMKDIISVPEHVYRATATTQQLRLMASIDRVENWQFEIIDSNNQVVRTYSGRGDTAIVLWNIKDNKGERVKAGNYKYRVSIMDDEGILPREVEIQVVN
jgi:fibronectin type 3 domain-containing protein